jgi:hypothetical protein
LKWPATDQKHVNSSLVQAQSFYSLTKHQTSLLFRLRECGRQRLSAPQTHLGIVRPDGPDTNAVPIKGMVATNKLVLFEGYRV